MKRLDRDHFFAFFMIFVGAFLWKFGSTHGSDAAKYNAMICFFLAGMRLAVVERS